MTGAKRRLIAYFIAVAVFGLAALLLFDAGRPAQLGPRPEGQRPELLVLTGLPILFPEGFTLKAPASPALKALESRYKVVPISVTDRASLNGHKLLLMAQPRAQPAQALVDLDAWVRAGGRVVLLADPSLQWPSDRPLGDPLAAPLSFADTGLLEHWGLRLEPSDYPGEKMLQGSGRAVRTAGPGELVATAFHCSVGRSRLVGRCGIGHGLVTVIADADFLDTDRLGGGGADNLGLLLGELDRYEH